MVVQHNITAMNAGRMLGISTSAQSKQAEQLSSGYRINRAGDDAAGLKISEKMRSQIRGLQKASTNAQDGVSLIQTAEGALNEAHSILQRMNELAVQGANDTNQDIDREAINQELNALTTELDRIAETTQFNKQNLLDGTFRGKQLQVGANVNQKISISIGAMNASAIGLDRIKVPTQDAYFNASGYGVATSRYATSTALLTSAADAASIECFNRVAWASGEYTRTAGASFVFTVGDKKYKISTGAGTSGDIQIIEAGAGSAAKVASVYAQGVSTAIKGELNTRLVVGVPEHSVVGATVSTYSKANATISKVQEAINRVSGQRSALGALQNRLEYTIRNLDNVAENTQAAESRIRDTDMAKAMVEYSKNQILAQAGQSMLAQANQSTQGVLSLLQ